MLRLQLHASLHSLLHARAYRCGDLRCPNAASYFQPCTANCAGEAVVTRKLSKPNEVPATPCKPSEQVPPHRFAKPIDTGYDPEDIRFIFVAPPKFVVGTTVPESVYFTLLDYKGGVSQFYTDAVTNFNGNLEALVTAAALFAVERRRTRQESPIRTANGRVPKEIFHRILELEKALGGIRGMSRAKVLSGLIQLRLDGSENVRQP